MLKNLLLLFIIIFLENVASPYLKRCFDRLGIHSKTLKIMVNDEKKFIPDILLIKITQISKEMSGRTSKRHSEFYINQSKKESCDDKLNIPNFMNSKTAKLITKIQVIWGGDKIIDDHEIHIKPLFPKQSFESIGKFQVFIITLDFDPDIISFPRYSSVDIQWTKVIKQILCDFKLCMRIFDHSNEFKFMTDFKCPLTSPLLLYRFNKFRIETHILTKEKVSYIWTNEYIAEIFQCDATADYSKLNVIVDPLTQYFEFQVIGPSGLEQSFHKMKFIKTNGKFQVETSEGYSPKLFDVDIKEKDITDAWPDRLTSFLLHYEDTKIDILYVKNKEFLADGAKTKAKYYVINAYGLFKDGNSNIEYYRKLTSDELIKEIPSDLLLVKAN